MLLLLGGRTWRSSDVMPALTSQWALAFGKLGVVSRQPGGRFAGADSPVLGSKNFCRLLPLVGLLAGLQ